MTLHPNTGRPVTPYDLLLDLRELRKQAEATAAGKQYVPRQRDTTDSDTVNITNPDNYADAALERAATEVAQQGEGGRNDALNRAAFALGKLVGAHPQNLLDEQTVTNALIQACADNGYLAEEGNASVHRTIERAMQDGMAEPLTYVHTPAIVVEPAPAFVPKPIIDPATGQVVETHTSWWHVDLERLLNGDDDPEPQPTYLERSDGRHVFYASKVNALIGESESGKTWVALMAVADTLTLGGRVLYLDFEDSPRGILARLKLLGVGAANFARLTYIGPDETLTPQAHADLKRSIDERKPELIVVDGVNAAMTLLGLDLTSNTDATRFSLDVLRPLRNTGAAVITIDHVTKSKDGRGSYAIGAQAKRADIDGCSIMVSVVEPFGRGQTGKLKLVVAKDRPGHVRGYAKDAKLVGFVTIASTEGRVDCRLDAPGFVDGEISYDDKIRAGLLKTLAEWHAVGRTESTALSNISEASTPGSNGRKLELVKELLADGYIVADGRHTHRVNGLKPFTATPVITSATPFPPAEDCNPPAEDSTAELPPPAPLPMGGVGGGQRRAQDIPHDPHAGEVLEP